MTDTTDHSHWQATANSSIRYADLPASADLVVIGGGIVGCFAALLAARGGTRVALLDARGVAAGATGRNGGFMTVGTAVPYHQAIQLYGHAPTRAIWDLTLASRTLTRQTLAAEGIACDYREPGRLNLALDDGQLATFATKAAALRADGYSGEVLDRATTQELIRTPLGEHIHGAFFSPGDALLHSARLVHGLAQAAQRHGAQIAVAEATGIVRDGDGLRVEYAGGSIRASGVVVAVNAWSQRVIPQLVGVVTPVRGQVLAYAPRDRVFITGIGAEMTATGEYWQQTPDGMIVIGGCRAAAPGGEVGEWTTATNPLVQSALETVLPTLFPQLDRLTVARRWAGLMGFTKDYLPVADMAPDLPGVLFAGGFCGHGMPFGAAFGRLLAEGALAGAVPAALAPFALERATLQ